MNKTLGITVNYNCISWALLDKEQQSPILHTGVRVFQPSVLNLGSGLLEESHLALRTKYRNARKSASRRQYRKLLLLRLLIENKMCPCPISAWILWKNKGIFPTKELEDWLKLNPYDLRVQGLSQKLKLSELGRVLYHLAQRRGKLVSKLNDHNKDKSIFMNGDPKTKRLGLYATQKQHKKGFTLGQHLATLQQPKQRSFKKSDERIRNRYLDRMMFVDEFHKLYDKQKDFHPSLNENLREKLGGKPLPLNDGMTGLLFFQRELKSSQTRRNKCLYERGKKGTPISNPIYEYFHILKWISQIQYDGKSLNTKQREKVLAIALRFTQFSFKKVRKALGMEDESIQFNINESSKIYLSHTLVNLGKPQLFGPTFFSKPLEEQIDIWHAIFFFDNEKKLQDYAIRVWGFSKEQSVRLCKLELNKGYAAVSVKAIRNFSYFLELGLTFAQAVFLSAVKQATEKEWLMLSNTAEAECIKELVKVYEVTKQNIKPESIKAILRKKYSITNFDLQKYSQYINADSLNESNGFQINDSSDQYILSHFKPILQKPVFELRKMVNTIINQQGMVDEIKLFIRPELKASRSGRKRQLMTRRKRNLTYEFHQKTVLEMGKNPTHTNVFKHRLWEEANRCCPYTGEPITIHQLFSNEVSIVYILPWRRFFNDSDQNKTICFTSFKHNIIDLTPWEYFTAQGPGVWEQVKTRILSQFLGTKKQENLSKFKQFTMSNYAQDAISNEFNDCHHVSLSIKELLQEVCPNVQMTLGHATHSLRKNWYLDSFDNFLENEPLGDYRRHGLDALITAVKTPELLLELTKWNRYEQNSPKNFPLPWKSFKKDVEREFYAMPISFQRPKQCFTIAVRKHKEGKTLYTQRSHSARGQLHKELFYGKRKSPHHETHGFHIRKAVEHIQTAKQVKKIVDPVLRQRIYDLVDASGGFDNGKVSKNALIYTADDGGIHSKVTMPNRRGDDVPVNKVRLCESITNVIQVYDGVNKYVNSRNNHHVLIYKDLEGVFQEDLVQFWTAVERKRNKEPLVQLPEDGESVITTLQINDCFLMGLSDEDYFNLDNLPKRKIMEHLYRVQRISTKFYEFRQVYDSDIYDTSFPNYIRLLNFGRRKTGWLTYNPKKVFVDNLGNIQKIKEIWTHKQPQRQS
ncbi:MAG: HNH endonuclease domain-containing protein [Flavobacteriaceae bacterium]|nr:HNH endonuclease domain-containing protein [Flavobacteriaceae bacterium]